MNYVYVCIFKRQIDIEVDVVYLWGREEFLFLLCYVLFKCACMYVFALSLVFLCVS